MASYVSKRKTDQNQVTKNVYDVLVDNEEGFDVRVVPKIHENQQIRCNRCKNSFPSKQAFAHFFGQDKEGNVLDHFNNHGVVDIYRLKDKAYICKYLLQDVDREEAQHLQNI